MKLWLLRARDDLDPELSPWNSPYNKNFGFVIRAFTEEDARTIANGNAYDENANGQPWLDADYSTCDELLADGLAGAVISDFYHA